MNSVTEGLLIALVGGIAGVISSLAAIALQGWKWKTGEQPKTATDAAASLTGASLSLVSGMRIELEAVRAEAVAARTEATTAREENAQMRIQLEELEDVREWAERLVHQVRSLGAEPVKMRKKRDA